MSLKLQLAITKIGDLLVNDRITSDEAGNEITSIKLTIPDYQRPYKWNAKHVIQLLDDIVSAQKENRETYRVGTLILHYDERNISYNIVDGQQRTITFSLMLKAFGKDCIGFLEQRLFSNQHNARNVSNAYQILERHVNSINERTDKDRLHDFIFNNCELIVVITNEISEAFQFFDSQNSRGKKLYPHDLLKAYHLREMLDCDILNTERIVKNWEDIDQKDLSALFGDYLYRVKEWTKGNRAYELTEHNIHKFKGIKRQDNLPFAQFYKGAFAYANMVNSSATPFVSGIRDLKEFQLDTPIIAGQPFFEYVKHYYSILKDIQNNDKYEGVYINNNEIIKTLDIRVYKNGVGNRITRLLFDTAVLLYVDRFCPERPMENDSKMLDQFILFAFIWAYSLRAQYYNLGWSTAQNYIMGADVVNSFNLYRYIAETNSPVSLLSELSDRIQMLPRNAIKAKTDNIDDQDNDGVYQNYLHHFETHNFKEAENEK